MIYGYNLLIKHHSIVFKLDILLIVMQPRKWAFNLRQELKWISVKNY